MATTIAITNGRVLLTIGTQLYALHPGYSVFPHPSNPALIVLSHNPSMGPKQHMGVEVAWDDITSPVVVSQNDAIDKVSLLGVSGAAIEQFVTAGGSGTAVTVTMSLTGTILVFVDGILLDASAYAFNGQDIEFTPAIADGKTITVIKL
jgi:hypothetical protein